MQLSATLRFEQDDVEDGFERLRHALKVACWLGDHHQAEEIERRLRDAAPPP